MGTLWQDALVTVAAAAALGWLVANRIRRRKAGGCSSCPSAELHSPAARRDPAPKIVPASSLRSKKL
jgi:hypothetical protein